MMFQVCIFTPYVQIKNEGLQDVHVKMVMSLLLKMLI